MNRSFLLRLVPLLLVVVFGIALYSGLGRNPYELTLVKAQQPMPVFSLPSLTEPSKRITEREFYTTEKKLTLLNVWASWCAACRNELPFLQQLAKQEKVSIYGLNYRDNSQGALHFLNQLGNPFTEVIFDNKGTLALQLGVYGAPESYLINSQGEILYRYAGELNDAVWQTEFLPRIQLAKAP